MLEVGLFDESPQPDSGIAPRTVLLEALRRHLPSGAADLVLVRVWAKAVRNGTTRTVGYQVEDIHDGRFSALARTTAFPATALAHLVVTGEVTTRGVHDGRRAHRRPDDQCSRRHRDRFHPIPHGVSGRKRDRRHR